jgi:polyhydroxybutyrate depolymerase
MDFPEDAHTIGSRGFFPLEPLFSINIEFPFGYKCQIFRIAKNAYSLLRRYSVKNIFFLKWEYVGEKGILGFFISRTIIVIASFLFISAFVANQSVVAQNEPQIQVGKNNRSIMSDNETRHYLLYIPAKYDGKTSLPLVFLFHGAGGAPESIMAVTDMGKLADEKNFIVVAPKGIYRYYGGIGWNSDLNPRGVNDLEFVKDLIREISSKVAVDQKRIYATGYSRGGRMSSRLPCELSNIIAAIGTVGGLGCPANCASINSVPVITFHGTADMVIPLSNAEDVVSCWVKKNGCNTTPMLRKISKDVTQISYSGCKDNGDVVFFSINEGGHTWPGSPSDIFEKMGMGKTNKDVNASNLIWSFFDAHPMR